MIIIIMLFLIIYFLIHNHQNTLSYLLLSLSIECSDPFSCLGGLKIINKINRPIKEILFFLKNNSFSTVVALVGLCYLIESELTLKRKKRGKKEGGETSTRTLCPISSGNKKSNKNQIDERG